MKGTKNTTGYGIFTSAYGEKKYFGDIIISQKDGTFKKYTGNRNKFFIKKYLKNEKKIGNENAIALIKCGYGSDPFSISIVPYPRFICLDEKLKETKKIITINPYSINGYEFYNPTTCRSEKVTF